MMIVKSFFVIFFVFLTRPLDRGLCRLKYLYFLTVGVDKGQGSALRNYWLHDKIFAKNENANQNCLLYHSICDIILTMKHERVDINEC